MIIRKVTRKFTPSWMQQPTPTPQQKQQAIHKREKQRKRAEFNILQTEILSACGKAGYSKKATTYCVHKIARYIKRFKDDIYGVEVSPTKFRPKPGYYSHHQINCAEGPLYIRIRID